MSDPLPPKFIRFDFYTVELPDDAGKFADYLKSATEIKDYGKRALAREGQQPIRWEFLERLHSGIWVGDITRIRDDVVPNKAARNRARERLVLKEDEGTTEDTIFAYSPKYNVLLCHSNRFGVTGRDIVDYFFTLAGHRGANDAIPVLSQKALADLEEFQYFDKIQFKVARPKNGPMPRTGLRSVDSCINAASEANARYFDLTISVGRAKAKMAKDFATELVGGLLRMVTQGAKRQPVKKLIITGMTSDGQHDVFDLLKNTLQSRQQVEVSKDRDLPYENRKSATIAAYKVCLPEIEALGDQEEEK